MTNPVAESFLKLTGIMNELREKCPWDRKQTISSLRQQTIEETFELADSISDENWQGIKEELGDLLLHVLFYAKIGEEQGRFSLQEVIDAISSKLISRHPHIYGNIVVADEQEVSRNWEKLKLKEGKASVLSGVPRSLPSTVKAMRLQEKAKQVGFEWENREQVFEKVLLTRPGFLSREYTRGRRASYLHPIRMYVFTSALFFLIFFSVVHFGGSSEAAQTPANENSTAEVARVRASVLAKATSKDDSVQLTRLMDLVGDEAVNIQVDSVRKNPARRSFIKILNDSNYTTKSAYDSAQKQLPENQRDGWFNRKMTYKQIELNQKLQKDPRGLFNVWVNKLMHQFPQLLFLSLPFFALILQLLYIRNKRYYYSDHAIFTIHLYIFTFISLLISLFFVRLQDTLEWNWLSFINFFITLYILWYTYKAMRNFYGQGRFKTFVKYCMLSFLSLFVILFLFVIFFMLSIIQL